MIKDTDWQQRIGAPPERSRRRRRRRRSGCLTRFLAFVLVVAALAGWFWWQQNGLSSEEIEVASAPDGFAGYRIVLISDLHVYLLIAYILYPELHYGGHFLQSACHLALVRGPVYLQAYLVLRAIDDWRKGFFHVSGSTAHGIPFAVFKLQQTFFVHGKCGVALISSVPVAVYPFPQAPYVVRLGRALI